MEPIKIDLTNSPQRAAWIKIWNEVRFRPCGLQIVGLECSRVYMDNQSFPRMLLSVAKITGQDEWINIYNYESKWYIETSSLEFAETVLTIFAVAL